MDFKKATDAICEGLDHEAISEALGVSVQTVRQARLEGGKAKRAPPDHWRRAIIRLAERRIMHYRHLIDELRSEEG